MALLVAIAAAAIAVCGCQGTSSRSVGTRAESATTAATTAPAPTAATTTAAPAPTAATTTTSPALAGSSTTSPSAAPATAGTAVAPATTTAPAATTSATTAPAASPCPAGVAGQLASTGGGQQLVTVVASSTGSTSATVTLWQRSGSCWTVAGGPWTGRVGFNGLSSHHREGDGTTPTGLYAIGSEFYGLAPDPGVHGSYHPLVCGDWWDEDPASAQYNTFQHLACGVTPPFGGGSEALWQQTVAYQRFAVVDYNTGPVVPGAGSAIFIHDDTGSGTNGCVSLPAGELDTLLRWLQPGLDPHIAIGTTGTIAQY